MLTIRGKLNYKKYKYYYGYLANNLDTKRRKVLYIKAYYIVKIINYHHYF